MKIALLGTRGIPASYSGFETCVEQLGQRLVQRGHEVTVYCRSHHITYEGAHYKGMRLVKLPTRRAPRTSSGHFHTPEAGPSRDTVGAAP